MFSLQRQILNKINRPISVNLVQRLSGQAEGGEGQSSSTPPQPPPQSGSSADSDNTTYKAKEYYGYNLFSFYDIDKDMSKFRNPQPSKYSPLEPAKK
uniref:NADH dehydrogenase [ubiquinone] flavoprotein 3, mitochondrial-like isoform X2 n=1 Tax=Crassostrea virginica TaxID=6565 RepID=A0A8B8E0C1_CRAVI|nr:NADH dehydrogenase [ubiquinone] flavoprotein 3, mitochondrial-like isoform X2 [Crassostrea virginica]